MNGIAGLADVVAVERRTPPLPDSTYAMIGRAAAAQSHSPPDSIRFALG